MSSKDDASSHHVHCSGCVLARCLYRGTETCCPMTSCDQNCGAVFHSCKKSEHVLFCPFEKVSCLNVYSGCCAVLRRHDLAKHLPVCPASIVCCTMEWCRWPVYSRERRERVPFALNNLRARSGQLDVALAMRDQRALSEGQKFRPRSVMRSLRNQITPRYPAVPLFVGGHPNFEDDKTSLQNSVSCYSDDSSEDNCEDAPWITSKKPPGLSSSICMELFREKSVTEQNFSNQLDLSAEFEHDVKCSLCTNNSIVRNHCISNTSDARNGNLTDGTISSHCDECNPLNITNPDSNSASSACKLAECMVENCNELAASPLVLDEALLHGNDLRNKISGYSGSSQKNGTSSRDHVSAPPTDDCNCVSSSSHFATLNTAKGINLLRSHESNLDLRDKNCTETGARSGAVGEQSDVEPVSKEILKPTPVPLALNEVLALDLNTEAYSRSNYRPKSMYTFMCGQMFRRDAYNRHFQNVHSDIHSGLSEWLEHRCPLAHYGCTFSVPRLRPTSTTIVFSPILESFGLKCKPCRANVDTSPCSDIAFTASSISSDTSSDSSKFENCPSRSFKEATPELFTSKDFDAAVVISRREVSPGLCSDVSLTSFPVELILCIAGFLDSFSLCNLSLTCWHLRNVCQKLLSRRGMVVQEWKRSRTGGRVAWTVSKQKWMFSTAFDPIRCWEYIDQSAMFRHLNVCPFYDKCELPFCPVELPVKYLELKESQCST